MGGVLWKLGMPLVAAIVLCPSVASSSGPPIFGMKGGLSAARYFGRTSEGGHRLGFAGGIAFQFPITPRFAIQPEFLVVMKGGARSNLSYTGSQWVLNSWMDESNFLEIPILARVQIPVHGDMAPFFVFGPSPAMEVNSEGSSVVQLGGEIGTGVEIGRGRARWLLEARYSLELFKGRSDPRYGALLIMAGCSIHPGS